MRCWVVISLVFLVTCGRDVPLASYPPVNLFEDAVGERVFNDVLFDTIWTYGVGDSLLASASSVEAFPNGDAAVLDILEQRIHRIGADGVIWSWGRRGEGPRELRNVRAMTVNREGKVVLADSGNQRLVWLSPTGEWLQEAPFPPVAGQWVSGRVTGIVALGGGGYILVRDGPESWVTVSEAGTVGSDVPSPWSGFAEMHSLQTLGETAGGASDRWAFGFVVGNGFFVFDSLKLLGSYPYAEHVDFPAVVASRLPSGGFRVSYPERPIQAASDMTVRGDTLLMLVRGSMVDRYLLTTGEYMGTTTLPGPSRGIAVSGDALFVIDGVGLFPTVTLLRAAGETK